MESIETNPPDRASQEPTMRHFICYATETTGEPIGTPQPSGKVVDPVKWRVLCVVLNKEAADVEYGVGTFNNELVAITLRII